MDYDLLLRYELAGAKFKYIDYDMAYFTMGGVTFSECTDKQKQEMISIIKKNGGTKIDVLKYRILKSIKMTIKKIVNIDTVLKLKNIKSNLM